MADFRADPVLKSILKSTLNLIDEEQEQGHEDADFHSDDEDEKCIDLSNDSFKNIANVQEFSEDLRNQSWQKKSEGSI